ncbi:hypothetical protein [Natronobacterium gregoryi]|uniref:Uncharacterized protein n=2 Tax=Natronobacterium gregoryi TaxID=44930 RepID=L0AKU4_NATGS|nr:hypothetical protein [Natronobacterium gregoryi]AFZ73650.1 hypothetical protein Natgr_2485 [Natronobacterium gregoryi SP2]PLK19626.1 hypothetical protein CYV19_13945 [Natronobacterium gregoryi SP2]SFJ00269.1 hypothetical protein SAMN05443661_11114 [Natronobacterium gregoryi]
MGKKEIVVEVSDELYEEIKNAREQGEKKNETIQRLIRKGIEGLSLPPLLTIITVVSGIIWVGSLAVNNETVSSLVGGFFIAFVGFWIVWRVIMKGL